MGQTTSAVRQLASPISSWFRGSSARDPNKDLENRITPFVYKRRGSMYIDEDGDIAHEFYEEVLRDRHRGRYVMKRCKRNIRPQGEVDLPFPRLNVDFPLVICEAPIR